MKKEYVSTGKNVEIAIKNGLLELGKSREDVDIKILETGGLFKKAKVILSYEEEILINQQPEVIEEPKDMEAEEKKSEISEEKEPEVELTYEQESVEEKTEEHIECEKEEIPQIKVRETKIVDKTRLKLRVTEFLQGLLKMFAVEGNVEVVEEDSDLKFLITGENVGKLIGYRGETLNAIQYVLGSLKEKGESKIRLYLDIEGYKDKRAEVLIDLANKMADKAEEIERNVHLDPMTPYERRIVHTALQNRTLVETESTGEGEKRHVVIKFKR